MKNGTSTAPLEDYSKGVLTETQDTSNKVMPSITAAIDDLLAAIVEEYKHVHVYSSLCEGLCREYIVNLGLSNTAF